MYRGFNLTVPTAFFSKFSEKGASLHGKNQKAVRDTLAAFKDASGNLVSSRMTAAWFPDVDAQVFISHAHKDSSMALGLAGHLHQEFGITSFVDSAVWGYSDDLLRMLDKNFCYNQDSNTYDYNKRNRSTAHVHMMLSVAISKMINQCECIIFLNTPHSIESEGYINGTTTNSPWIFSEIAMTSLIEKRLPVYHRMAKSEIAMDSFTEDLNLTVKYDVNLDHLHDLNANNYNAWVKKSSEKVGKEALDVLYEMTS